MEIGVLGPVEVWRDGRPTDAGHARQRAVLAVLVLDAGRVVPLETLIDRVWGEDPPRSVRNVVYGYVARLRGLIAVGQDRQDPGVSLSRQVGGYLLQAAPDQIDVCRFRRLVAGASAGDDQAAAALREAVALWRGPALAGLKSPWLNGMRATLELERTAAVLDLNEIRLRQGENGALVSDLAGQVAAAPADERLVGQLMLALYRSGRQDEALRCYERTRRHLADELGADPSPDLQTLHQQVLRADPALARPVLAVLADPPATPAPRELPADVTAFTGRAAELAELDRLLATSAARTGASAGTGPAARVGRRRVTAAVISAVSGTAGVGKTALAVHWAHHAAGRFPDGQLYVNLRGCDPDRPMTAAEALTGFLRALGVRDSGIPADQDQRAARYRSLLAGRRMLIVLDNARHSEQVRPLLPGSPGCAVVVTSRDALAGLVARDGAVRLDLDPLPLAEAVNLLRELIGDRADADPAAAAMLAARCCRLPLALRVAAELAATRLAVPLAALVAELADLQRRLDLLDAAGDARTAVRAVFSWSYRRIDPAAAHAFRLVGHQPGPEIDPRAAAALTRTTIDQARQILDVLARAHLIHPTGPGRYAMHDLLRAYARDLAAEHDSDDDLQAALTRICDHHVRVAASTMSTLSPASPAERRGTPPADPSVRPAPALRGQAPPGNWLDEQLALLIAAAADCTWHGTPEHATRLDLTLLRRANAILRTASAVIAAALDGQ